MRICRLGLPQLQIHSIQSTAGLVDPDIAPLDPDGTLQHEWLNSRGAIARFDRNAIEIRVLDIQECPVADLAICFQVMSFLKIFDDANQWFVVVFCFWSYGESAFDQGNLGMFAARFDDGSRLQLVPMTLNLTALPWLNN